MNLFKPLLFVAVLGLAGCTAEDIPFVYKIDIPQGNIITQEDLARLEPGMTKQQVTFLLGTPLLTDPFHQNQWEYVYMFIPGSDKERDGDKVEQQLLRVYFKDGVVEKYSFIEEQMTEDEFEEKEEDAEEDVKENAERIEKQMKEQKNN